MSAMPELIDDLYEAEATAVLSPPVDLSEPEQGLEAPRFDYWEEELNLALCRIAEIEAEVEQLKLQLSERKKLIAQHELVLRRLAGREQLLRARLVKHLHLGSC